MKHEAIARALTQLDDALIAEAASHAPRKGRYFPHVLAAAACLALVLAAALSMTRSTLPAEIRIGGSALSSAPIPIEQPAPLALSPADAQPLSISLTIESRAETPAEISVSGGVLDSPADSTPRDLSSRTVSGSESVCRMHRRFGSKCSHGRSKRRTRARSTRSLSTAAPPPCCTTTQRTDTGLSGRRKHSTITRNNSQHFGGKFP